MSLILFSQLANNSPLLRKKPLFITLLYNLINLYYMKKEAIQKMKRIGLIACHKAVVRTSD